MHIEPAKVYLITGKLKPFSLSNNVGETSIRNVLQVANGDPVSVECSVSGYPAPAIQWFRNGAELVPQHDRYTISYDGETTTLKFVSIATSDAGKYVCIATNHQGEAKTAMQLDVEPRRLPPVGGTPPKFSIDKRRESIRASDGDKVVLVAELLEGLL